jgi:hypothetical protein
MLHVMGKILAHFCGAARYIRAAADTAADGPELDLNFTRVGNVPHLCVTLAV